MHKAGRDRPARGVDVEEDVLLGVLRLEEQHLGDDQIRDVVVDRLAEEDDVVFEQPRVDVVGALAARRLLHDHGDQDHFLVSLYSSPSLSRAKTRDLWSSRASVALLHQRRNLLR
jgi:hypothetical protein